MTVFSKKLHLFFVKNFQLGRFYINHRVLWKRLRTWHEKVRIWRNIFSSSNNHNNNVRDLHPESSKIFWRCVLRKKTNYFGIIFQNIGRDFRPNFSPPSNLQRCNEPLCTSRLFQHDWPFLKKSRTAKRRERMRNPFSRTFFLYYFFPCFSLGFPLYIPTPSHFLHSTGNSDIFHHTYSLIFLRLCLSTFRGYLAFLFLSFFFFFLRFFSPRILTLFYLSLWDTIDSFFTSIDDLDERRLSDGLCSWPIL